MSQLWVDGDRGLGCENYGTIAPIGLEVRIGPDDDPEQGCI